jgi:hypothetical protein
MVIDKKPTVLAATNMRAQTYTSTQGEAGIAGQKLGPLNMLVFAGLWTLSDKAGNFLWQPEQIKLDVLPFVKYDVGTSLELLRKSGYIIPYSGPDGRQYGHIPTFKDHQRFWGSEAKGKPRLELPGTPAGTSLDRGLFGDTEIRSNGKDGTSKEAPPRASRFTPPTLKEVSEYCQARKNSVDPEKFIAHYESNGWRVGRNPMKNWQAAVRTWEKSESQPAGLKKKTFKVVP